MRWIVVAVGWGTLLFLNAELGLILAATLFLTSILVEPEPAQWIFYKLGRDVVRTVRAAAARVRRRRAATDRPSVDYPLYVEYGTGLGPKHGSAVVDEGLEPIATERLL